MYKRIGFVAIVIMLVFVFLAGCTTTDSAGIPIIEENETLSAEQTASSLVTGNWSSGEMVNGALVTYSIGPAGVLKDTWVFNGTWTLGASENGTVSYLATYTDGTVCTYYLTENGTVFDDGTGDINYEKQNGTSVAGDDPIVGTWVYKGGDFSGSLTFDADGNVDESWTYYGEVKYEGLSDNDGYVFDVDYPDEEWDFTFVLSSNGETITDSNNSILYKV